MHSPGWRECVRIKRSEVKKRRLWSFSAVFARPSLRSAIPARREDELGELQSCWAGDEDRSPEMWGENGLGRVVLNEVCVRVRLAKNHAFSCDVRICLGDPGGCWVLELVSGAVDRAASSVSPPIVSAPKSLPLSITHLFITCDPRPSSHGRIRVRVRRANGTLIKPQKAASWSADQSISWSLCRAYTCVVVSIRPFERDAITNTVDFFHQTNTWLDQRPLKVTLLCSLIGLCLV